jgi:hypothetical protein
LTDDDDDDDEDDDNDDEQGTFNDEDDEALNMYDDTFNENNNNTNYDDYDSNNYKNGNNKKKKTVATENLRNSNGRIRKFSDNIRMELERHFQKNRYISGDEKKLLADKLNLTVRQVQKWFVHRREKFRRYEKHHGKKQNNLNNNNNNSLQEQDEDEDEMIDEDDCDDSRIKEEKVDFNEDLDVTLPLEADEELIQQESNNQDGYHKYSPYIENYLEKLFRKKHQLTQRDLNSACLNLNLKPKQVRLWFHYRRLKHQQQQQEQQKQMVNNKNNMKRISFNEIAFEENGEIDLNKRQNYPEHVLRQLENAFLRNRYISGNDKRILSKKLGLAPIQIERWFYTRRKKFNMANFNNKI